MGDIGTWLDKGMVNIITIRKTSEQFETLLTRIVIYRPTGRSGSKSPMWVPQDVMQESKFLECEKLHFTSYFKNLVKVINTTDNSALFGPAETANVSYGIG